MAAKRRRIVPFRRTLKQGDHGRDVVAIKRGLIAAGSLKRRKGQKLTINYGENTVRAVKLFQRRHGLPADGVYGPRTHHALRRYIDPYGAWLMGHTRVADPEIAIRTRIVNEAIWLFNVNEAIHYAQVRPMTSLHLGHQLPQTMDCSENVTVCYFRAGAPDPNGRGYDGFGYTGTLAQRGHPVSLHDAKPADAVLYGRAWPYEHTAIYTGHGRVMSHGQESGPQPRDVYYRQDVASIRSYL